MHQKKKLLFTWNTFFDEPQSFTDAHTDVHTYRQADKHEYVPMDAQTNNEAHERYSSLDIIFMSLAENKWIENIV